MAHDENRDMPNFLNEGLALDRIGSISDSAVRGLAEMALDVARQRLKDPKYTAAADFDALYFVNAIVVFFSRTKLVENILNGETSLYLEEW